METADRWYPSGSVFRAYVPPSQIDRPPLNVTGRPRPLVVEPPIVVKLTKDIIETYRCCNPAFCYSDVSKPKRYLTNPSTPVSNGGLDNENSDLILTANGVLINGDLNHRYIIKDLLGQGTFGQVAKCWAVEMETYVAVKIIKNQPAYGQQAVVEISILKMLNDRYDPEDSHHIVRIFEHFVYQEHLCIVFEMLGMNLYELLKANHLKGFSLKLIRTFSKQMLTALTVLRDASVIHCDLKPENILLTTRPESAEVKLIDFGSACKEDRTVYSYIQSRFYRSPEVVIGHEYTTSIDMWSFGCVLAELFLGLPLFPAQSQYDLLQRMMKILGGKPPDFILRNAKNTNKYFKHTGAWHSDFANQQSSYQFLTLEEFEAKEKERPLIGRYYFAEEWDLERLIMNYPMRKGMTAEEIELERYKREVFMDFLKGLVNFDPVKRWSPCQAAQHPFITEEPFTGSFQPPDEAPRMPIHQGLTVDHNPVAGHWLGTGLSPQVNPTMLQFGSPQYHAHPFSYGSSYGSVGSYGSYGDGCVGLANSFGSYCDPSGAYLNHWPPSTMVNTAIGMSPDARHRIGHFPANPGLGHAQLGISPSGAFIPVGTTPPNYHFQSAPGSPSTGSPGRHGPTSPARSGGGGAASLGKAAAYGQYRRRGFGSPGSGVNPTRSSGFDSSGLSWHGSYQNPHPGSLDSSYGEGVMQNNSPRGSSHQSSQFRPRGLAIPGTSSTQTPYNSSANLAIGSLGTLMSRNQPTSTDADDPPTPSSGDGNPDFSEEDLFETDAPEVASSNISTSTGATVEESTGRGNYNMAPPEGFQSSITRQVPMYPVNIEGSPHAFHSYGSNLAARPPYYSQISPSRLGQQSAHLQQQQLQLQQSAHLQLHLHQHQQFLQYQQYQLRESAPHSIPDNFGNQFYPQGQRNGSMNGVFPAHLIRRDRRMGS